MKCLRCGYCCSHYAVVIVDDPEIGFDPMKDENLVTHEGNGPCKHLRGDKPGEFSCAIHDKPWYPLTPCAQFEQIGRPEAECRMGRYQLDKFQEKEAKENGA